MNTYDFDKTICVKDSSVTFYKYCLKKYPAAVWRTIPATLRKAAAYIAGRISTKELKEQLFSFLRYIDDIDSVVSDF